MTAAAETGSYVASATSTLTPARFISTLLDIARRHPEGGAFVKTSPTSIELRDAASLNGGAVPSTVRISAAPAPGGSTVVVAMEVDLGSLGAFERLLAEGLFGQLTRELAEQLVAAAEAEVEGRSLG